LLSTNYPNFRILLVDNHSDDRSLELITQEFKEKIQVLSLDHNYGFAEGNNLGAANENSDYLVFLNPDTNVDPDWLSHLVSTMESDSNIGIAQPKLLQMDRKRIDSTGGFIDSYGLAWSRGHNEIDSGQYDRFPIIFYAKGAALIIRKELWNKLRGFDSLFFVYYEETDLCWRAWESGYRVVYVPSAIVYHAGGGVLNKVPSFIKFNEAKGRLLMLIKHYSKKEFIKKGGILLVLHTLNILRQFAIGDARSGLAIFRGTLWCLVNFKKILASRQEVYARVSKHISPDKVKKNAYVEKSLFF
jgi:GT2 family glycosyltransferase